MAIQVICGTCGTDHGEVERLLKAVDHWSQQVAVSEAELWDEIKRIRRLVAEAYEESDDEAVRMKLTAALPEDER